MVDALKKMDKKFLIIAGCLLGLPILLIIFLAIIQGCSSNKTNYESYEKEMISAAKKYISKEKIELTQEGDFVDITLDKLIDKKLIKSPEKLLDDKNCTGNVKAILNGSSVEINNGGFVNYIVSLKCDSYSTPTFAETLIKDVVTSGSGLYKIGDEYIFRGDKVNNYVSFYGDTYRIMSIDSDNSIRLIRETNESVYKPWDDKYNINVDAYYGKNIYKDSSILTELLSDYSDSKKFSNDEKKHIIAHDVCVGRRSYDDYSIDKGKDCSEKLEKQIVSLISVSDFALASIDPDCTSVVAQSCDNYNYLSYLLSSSWTTNAVTENTYEVFSLSSGIIEHEQANKYHQYNIIVYMDGNEKTVDGAGTEMNPYVFK